MSQENKENKHDVKVEEEEYSTEAQNESSEARMTTGQGQTGLSVLRITIGMKITAGFILALIALVIIGTVSFRSILSIMQDVALVEHSNQVLRTTSLLEISIINAQRSSRGYIITGDEKFLDDFYKEEKAHVDILNDLKALVLDQGVKRLLEPVKPSLDELFNHLKEVVNARKNQNFDSAVELVKSNKAEKSFLEFVKYIDLLRAGELKLLDQRAEVQHEAERIANLTIIWGTVLAFCILLVVGLFISRRITANLKKVVESLNKSAQTGDLTQQVFLRTSDELNVLAGSFNMIQKAFHGIISRIANAALKIMSTSNELLAAANQQESTTQEQSAQINQIQSTLNEFASTAAEVSQTTKELSKLVDETSEEAERGTLLIKDANDKMRIVGDSNKSVAGKIKILNDNIEGIGKMLTVIVSVADQTNLLSLNAAIEAAKAGEHGKGFSVVAQEIRRLADQTAQSSKEISALINDIQVSSSGVLMSMEKSNQDIKVGVEIVEEMASRFLAISDRVESVSNQFETIASSVQEQAAGQKEVSASMLQMTEALRLTASSAKEVGKSAYDLTSLGQQLRSAVGQFKLR